MKVLPAAALASALALGHAGAHALGASLSYNSFAVADAVTSVTLCGNRSAGRNKPAQPYRVVAGEYSGQSVLFVQWMNPPDEATNGRPVVAHTLGIAELNNDHAEILLRNLRCTAKGQGIVLSADVDFGHEDKPRRRRMQLSVGPALDKYQIRFTPPL
ncbi:MAG: hypothetical protein ACN6O3_06050 [Comamonas sp.]